LVCAIELVFIGAATLLVGGISTGLVQNQRNLSGKRKNHQYTNKKYYFLNVFFIEL